jgi:hypothetical protein
MVAHISSNEARLLKSLGGSGTINPHTGLPEFFSIGSVFKPVQRAIGQLNPLNPGSAVSKAVDSIPIVGDINRAANNLGTQIFQPLEKAIVQPASAGLASFDKMVGKAIPGGWGTVAQVAASMIPGAQPLAIGIGALNGSGVMHKGGKFNLQGAMIGGATAYATSELGEYMRAANGTADAAMLPVSESAVPPPPTNDFIGSFANQNPPVNGDFISGFSGANPAVPPSPPPAPGFFSNLASGNISTAAGQAGDAIYNAGKSVIEAPGNAIDAVKNYDYSAATKGMGDTISGAGKIFSGSADPAAAAAVKAGTTMAPMMATAGTVYGVTSLAAMDEQRKYLEEAKAANAISQAEYDKAMGEINRSAEDASKAVRDNPFSTTPSRDTSIGDTYYARSGEGNTIYGRGNENTTLYAMGGAINPPDDQTYLPNQTPMQRLENKGIMGLAAGGMTPRFLSGGGDGMSDSIKARINGSQEARLADGEFVIPADVVSHLGNGSSKAGAKQLYSMMDKVRTARTGRKSQGKQINPRKYLAA